MNGLDHHYFEKKLKLVVRDVKMYTPDEMFNELSRLMVTAGNQAGFSVEIKCKFPKPSKKLNERKRIS
jgi:hypothetical protein